MNDDRNSGVRRGFMMPELVVMGLVGGILIGILLPALAKARARARTVHDASQIRQIHQGMIIWAADHDGSYPTPGRVNRIGDTPGRGEEDVMINTTDNLFSLMIAQNFIMPELCISPVESSGQVRVDADYSWDKVDIPGDVYWDEGFTVDLDGSDGHECNTSYAHMLIAGERKDRRWRNTSLMNSAVIGNRGVVDGSTDPADYFPSNSLRFHGSHRAWQGNICYADCHVELADSFTPGSFEDDQGMVQRDNLFRNDTDPEGIGGVDNWLTICSAMGGDPDNMTIVLEWD